MNEAMNRDKEESEPLWRSPFTSKTQKTRTKDASRVVIFHLLRSITDTQAILVPRERQLGDAALRTSLLL
jgi:hypothetical protein